MKIKEKYEKFDLIGKIEKYLTDVAENDTQSLERSLGLIKRDYEYIKQNNLENIVLALNTLGRQLDEKNIEIFISINKDTKFCNFNNFSIFWECLAWSENRRCITIINDENIPLDKIVINVKYEKQFDIENILNNICDEWQDVFEIKEF